MDLYSNPLIKPIPKLLNKKNFIEKFNKSPELKVHKSEERNLIETDKITVNFSFGCEQHYYFYERVISKMFTAYDIKINENVIQRLNEINNLTEEQTIHILNQEINTQPSVFGTYLMGLAGTGKTTLVDSIVNLYPRFVIQTFHPHLIFKQIPILKITTPHKSSRKDFCNAILSAMDTILFSNYVNDYKGYSEVSLTNMVKNKVLIHFVGTIIVDEFQDLRTRSGPPELTLAFIKNISNTLKLPIVFVGSFEIEEILFGNWQLCTRNQGFQWFYHKQNSKEYKDLIDELFKHSVIGSQNLAPEISDAYYKLTAGAPRTLTLLHAEAQKICIHSKKKHITILELLIAAKNLFASTNKVVDAIVNHNTALLKNYGDLKFIELPDKPKSNKNSGTHNKSNYKKQVEFSDKSTEDKSLEDLIDASVDRMLLDLYDNSRSLAELEGLYKEHGLIKPIEEILTF